MSNFTLIYFYQKNILSNKDSFIFLLLDILQLSTLIYHTGGILNPFSIFLIIPSVFSSSNLELKASLTLISLTNPVFAGYGGEGTKDKAEKISKFRTQELINYVNLTIYYLYSAENRNERHLILFKSCQKLA